MNCNKEKKIANEIIKLIENSINQAETFKSKIEDCQIEIEDVANIRKFFKIKISTENKINSISEIKIIKILEKYYNLKLKYCLKFRKSEYYFKILNPKHKNGFKLNISEMQENF